MCRNPASPAPKSRDFVDQSVTIRTQAAPTADRADAASPTPRQPACVAPRSGLRSRRPTIRPPRGSLCARPDRRISPRACFHRIQIGRSVNEQANSGGFPVVAIDITGDFSRPGRRAKRARTVAGFVVTVWAFLGRRGRGSSGYPQAVLQLLSRCESSIARDPLVANGRLTEHRAVPVVKRPAARPRSQLAARPGRGQTLRPAIPPRPTRR